MDVTLATVAGSAGFLHSPAPYLLLDRRLRIRGVNQAYLRATARSVDELLGVDVFTAFPDNPGDPTADGVAQLSASLHRVLRDGQAHDMLLQRYAIPAGDGFTDRVWSPVNSPVTDVAGHTAGILHHVQDVTGLQQLTRLPPPDLTELMPVLRTRLRDNATTAEPTRDELAAQVARLAGALVKVVASPGLTDPAPALIRREQLWRAVVDRARRPGWRGWAHALCRTVLHEIPGAHGAALSVHTTDGVHQLLAASGPWAGHLDELHLTVGQGPALTAQATGVPVLVPDLSTQHARWPGYTAAAASHGLTAVHSYPVRVHHVPVATLTVYGRSPAAALITRGTADTALLAGLAGPIVADDLDGIFADALSETPTVRGPSADIAVATGILSVRHHLSVDDALLRLRAAAFARGIPLTTLAAAVITGEESLD